MRGTPAQRAARRARKPLIGICACTRSGRSARNSRTSAMKARKCASGEIRRARGSAVDAETLGAHGRQQRPVGADTDHLVAARADAAHQRQQEMPEGEVDVGELDDFHAVIEGLVTAHPTLLIAHFTCCGPSAWPVITTCSLRRGSGAAEIDAVLDAHPPTVGAQPPAGAGAQPQQHRLAALLRAGADVGVQVEAQGEGLRARAPRSCPRRARRRRCWRCRGCGGAWRRRHASSRRDWPPASARRRLPGAAGRGHRGGGRGRRVSARRN